MTTARDVLRWIGYCEYVAAWLELAADQRPTARARKLADGAWIVESTA